MAKEEEKEPSKKDLILELLKTVGGSKQDDLGQLQTLLPLLSANKDKQLDMNTVLLLANMSQKKSGIEDLIQALIAWRMAESMMEDKNKEDEITKILKYQMVMQSVGGQKTSNIDEILKIMSILGTSNKSVDELKETLKQMQMEQSKQKEIDNITKEHEKHIEELRKTNEQTVSQLKDYIMQLTSQINNLRQQPQTQNTFFDELRKVTELNEAVRRYAEMMGWGKQQGLPEKGEEWKPGDYLKALEQIGSTVSNIVGGFASAQATKKERKEVKEIPEQVQEQPQNITNIPQQNVPPPPPPTPPPQTTVPQQEQKQIDPEIAEYVESLKETPEGWLDKYGNLFTVPEGTTLKDFKQRAYQQPEAVKQMIEESKQAYEEEMKKAQQPEQQEPEQQKQVNEEKTEETENQPETKE